MCKLNEGCEETLVFIEAGGRGRLCYIVPACSSDPYLPFQHPGTLDFRSRYLSLSYLWKQSPDTSRRGAGSSWLRCGLDKRAEWRWERRQVWDTWERGAEGLLPWREG